jgi:hypothetical protein
MQALSVVMFRFLFDLFSVFTVLMAASYFAGNLVQRSMEAGFVSVRLLSLMSGSFMHPPLF